MGNRKEQSGHKHAHETDHTQYKEQLPIQAHVPVLGVIIEQI